MNKKELLKELNEIERIKLPHVEEKINEARKQGQLSENVAYSEAREEKVLLEERIEEIKDIFVRGNIKRDYKELLKLFKGDSFNNNFKPIKDFFKTYHKEELYYSEEASILLNLNKLRGRYLIKGLEQEADRLFELQTEILSLTKDDENKDIHQLFDSWDSLFDATSSLDNDPFSYDLDKISEDKKEKYYKPLERLIKMTLCYFEKKQDNLFTHSELCLINHIYVSFLPTVSSEPNEYYYKLNQMFSSIVKE